MSPIRGRARRTLRGHLARALVKTVAVTISGLALVAFGSVGSDVSSQRFDGRTVTGPARTPVDRLMQRYDCSTTGYGGSATPQSAIVQRPSGRLAAVTFDEGWRVYTADGAATLVAVCLRPVP